LTAYCVFAGGGRPTTSYKCPKKDRCKVYEGVAEFISDIFRQREAEEKAATAPLRVAAGVAAVPSVPTAAVRAPTDPDDTLCVTCGHKNTRSDVFLKALDAAFSQPWLRAGCACHKQCCESCWYKEFMPRKGLACLGAGIVSMAVCVITVCVQHRLQAWGTLALARTVCLTKHGVYTSQALFGFRRLQAVVEFATRRTLSL
jgi:hypothetical protein